MTPLQLHVILHAHTTNSWEGMEKLRDGNQTWCDQVAELVYAGLLETNSSRSHSIFGWKLTAKGKFWFEYILNVPYPISEWKIPNE